MSMVILEIPKIEGECQVENYQKMILCESLSHDMNVEMEVSTNARRTVHTPKVENIALERKWDLASPKLISRLLRAQSDEVWKIHCLKPLSDDNFQWVEFLTLELTSPMLSKHSLSVSEGDTTESIEINATEINWVYKLQDEKNKKTGGSMGVSFNLLTGRVKESA
ncbi:type VI secretion system tube protein Hcp [Azospirillum canadense]|uniref:type VI secretion system tube protein Hcp n=1 Tax=Azospirillum canadense TaxID=403962 RepID=UPI002226254D|nr:type VI secretion system tube protein Hcp [Azospirillum canadense]MCW2242965.1 type VI protein secretion system component Hcp [Azospirillum canadense]